MIWLIRHELDESHHRNTNLNQTHFKENFCTQVGFKTVFLFDPAPSWSVFGTVDDNTTGKLGWTQHSPLIRTGTVLSNLAEHITSPSCVVFVVLVCPVFQTIHCVNFKKLMIYYCMSPVMGNKTKAGMISQENATVCKYSFVFVVVTSFLEKDTEWRHQQEEKAEQRRADGKGGGTGQCGCNNSSVYIFLCSKTCYTWIKVHHFIFVWHSCNLFLLTFLRVSRRGPGLSMTCWTTQPPTQSQTKNPKPNPRKRNPKKQSVWTSFFFLAHFLLSV